MSQSYALEGVRADLTADAEIIALMAQDLNELRRENGCATHPELLQLGWTQRQVKRCFLRALEQAFKTYSETRDTPHEAEQAKPFLKFDVWMRDVLNQRGYAIPSAAANEVA